MTSREAFEAKHGKRGDGSLSYSGWDFRWSTWQAAERDMLERAIAACHACDSFYTEDVIPKLKELLNEQH